MPSQVSSSQDQPMPDAATDNNGGTAAPPEPVLELGERRILIVSHSFLGRSDGSFTPADYLKRFILGPDYHVLCFVFRLLTPKELARIWIQLSHHVQDAIRGLVTNGKS